MKQKRTRTSSNCRLSTCRGQSSNRKRNLSAAFQPLVLHICAAMLACGSSRHQLFGTSRRSMLVQGLALHPPATSATAYLGRRVLHQWRIQPCSTHPGRIISSRHPPASCLLPGLSIRRRARGETRLDVAKFAFAERSAAASSSASASASLSSAFSTVAAPVVPTLGAYDIRCSLTGRVVCERVVDLAAPEGRCIGYAVPASEDDSRNNHNDAEPAKGGPSHSLSSVAALQSPRHWIREYLHPREVDFAMEQPSGVGRTSFLLGRLALRQALESVSRIGDHDNAHSPATGTTTTVPFRSSWHEFADCVLLKDAHGRPNVPRGYLGSVSHKKNVAVALVARDGGNADGSNLARAPPPHDSTKPPTHGVGVDLEAAAPRNKISIARKVLTAEEIDALGNVPGLDVDEEVLLRFSIKESLYKAIHPLICQYVGFQEAVVQPLVGGDVVTVLNLRSGAHERFGTVTSHWRRLGGYFLSTSSVSLLAADEKGIGKR